MRLNEFGWCARKSGHPVRHLPFPRRSLSAQIPLISNRFRCLDVPNQFYMHPLVPHQMRVSFREIRVSSNTLTDVQIRKAKKEEKPCRLTDSGGLHLYVAPSGSKLWRMRYRFR
ncbi:Arm DNA-binding domain-containing protein [Peteryoungia aggregata]|uniref:Arm DNA-binding domain-containing protein n=1 Tax=Peteryoungia aggregata TaxID=34013 RepID=UPI0035222DBB